MFYCVSHLRRVKRSHVFLHWQDVDMEDSEVRVLDVADPKKQESLQSENEPDPMDAEQTWPTEEELAQAQGSFSVKQLVKTSLPWVNGDGNCNPFRCVNFNGGGMLNGTWNPFWRRPTVTTAGCLVGMPLARDHWSVVTWFDLFVV